MIKSLEKSQDPDTFKAIAGFLKNQDWRVRKTAVEVMGNRKEKDVVLNLGTLYLMEPDWRVRQTIAHALGFIKGELAYNYLVKMTKDKDWHIRQAAISALKYFKTSGAILVIVKMLEDPQWHVKVQAMDSLSFIGDTGTSQYIAKYLKSSDPTIRNRAKIALKKLVKDPSLKQNKSCCKEGQSGGCG